MKKIFSAKAVGKKRVCPKCGRSIFAIKCQNEYGTKNSDRVSCGMCGHIFCKA